MPLLSTRSLSDIAVRNEASVTRRSYLVSRRSQSGLWLFARYASRFTLHGGRARLRWSRIVRRSRKVNVGQAPKWSRTGPPSTPLAGHLLPDPFLLTHTLEMQGRMKRSVSPEEKLLTRCLLNRLGKARNWTLSSNSKCNTSGPDRRNSRVRHAGLAGKSRRATVRGPKFEISGTSNFGSRRFRRIVQEKSLHFTVQLVNHSRRLRKNSTDLVLTRQRLRSGASIEANVEEAGSWAG